MNPSNKSRSTVEPVNLVELKAVLEQESAKAIEHLYEAIMKELRKDEDVDGEDGRRLLSILLHSCKA